MVKQKEKYQFSDSFNLPSIASVIVTATASTISSTIIVTKVKWPTSTGQSKREVIN